MPYTKLHENPPLPGDAEDQSRREHTRKRRRILTGYWQNDLNTHLREHFDPIRKHIVGKPDQSTNVLRSVVYQLAALYTRTPVIMPPSEVSEEQVQPLLDAVAAGGYWSMAQRVQRFTLGMRECFVRPTWKGSDEGGLMFRIVPVDMTYAEAPPDDPDLPHYVVEARPRIYKGEEVWTWDEVDLRDPAKPTFRVLLVEDKSKGKGKSKREVTDITEDIMGARYDGAAYPFRDEQNQPLMPYVLYHSERTGELFDAFEGLELVEGALTIAVLWTYWLHNVRDCAWAQKWTLDAYLRGTSKKGKKGDYSEHSAVTTDPSSVMQFRSDGTNPASIGQWSPPVDPKTLGEAIRDFEERLAVHFDLAPTDISRSGTASSGYAISLKRSAVREAQRRFEPQFQRADQQLFRVSAMLMNRGGSVRVPEQGYSFVYRSLPRSLEEVEAALVKHEKLRALGLESRVDAYMDLNEGTTREKALERLLLIAQEERTIESGVLPLPGPQ